MADKKLHSARYLHIVLGLLVILLLTPLAAAAGSTDNVKDELEYLSTDELNEIQSKIDEAVSAHNLDIVIVITDQTQGKSSRDFADDYYDYNGYGIGNDASGLLLLINMDIREVWISTTGKAINIFTDSRIDSILDVVAPYLSEGNYYSACIEFINQVERYAKLGVPQGQYQEDEKDEYYPDVPPDYYPDSSNTYLHRAVRLMTSPTVFIIAIVAAILATIIASSGNRGRVTVSNRTYEEGGSFQLADKRDDFINETVTRVRVSSSTSSGGSSGRSSVHRGSSGRSHGGGGRRF